MMSFIMERLSSRVATGALALCSVLHSGAEAAENPKVLKSIELDPAVTYVLDRTVIDVGLWNRTAFDLAAVSFTCKGFKDGWYLSSAVGEVLDLPIDGRAVLKVYFHGLAHSVVCRVTGAVRE